MTRAGWGAVRYSADNHATYTSEQRHLQQLFNTKELGDHKPMQLLRHMHQLLGDKATTTDNSLMRELFLQCLPTNAHMVLTSTPDIKYTKNGSGHGNTVRHDTITITHA